MLIDKLKPGLRHSETLTVEKNLTVPGLAALVFREFNNMPPVFATAYMIGFIEWTCAEALKPYLGSHERSVGIHVNMSHSAATPIGMKVTAEVELVEVNDRRLRFKVMCRDEVEVIGEGYHERFIIDYEKFLS
ncbi:MAG: thioesterase family protein, partial [Pyrinomonadaceae bacterium]